MSARHADAGTRVRRGIRRLPSPPGVPADETGRLLALIAGGDRAAFARFYDLTAPRVFGLVCALVSAPDARARVTVQAYVRVLRCAATFMPEREDPLTWVAAFVRLQVSGSPSDTTG